MRLQDARRAKNLTQAQLGQRASVGQTLISQIESGRVQSPSHRTVVRVCRVLEVDPQDIDEFRISNGGNE